MKATNRQENSENINYQKSEYDEAKKLIDNFLKDNHKEVIRLVEVIKTFNYNKSYESKNTEEDDCFNRTSSKDTIICIIKNIDFELLSLCATIFIFYIIFMFLMIYPFNI